jgi:snurportin-1
MYLCRFWWRDTRLAELPAPLPPSNASITSGGLNPPSSNSSYPNVDAIAYHFPYPVSLLPVPYHTNTALPYLTSHVIPLARSLRLVSIDVPTIPLPAEGMAPTMEVDGALPISPMLTPVSISLEPDGMLLYVSQASYEPGTSPLSSWIPITGYTKERDGTDSGCQTGSNRPLDLFER